MTERMVEIPVERSIREQIKAIKGTRSYSNFLEAVLNEIEIKETKPRLRIRARGTF